MGHSFSEILFGGDAQAGRELKEGVRSQNEGEAGRRNEPTVRKTPLDFAPRRRSGHARDKLTVATKALYVAPTGLNFSTTHPR